MIKHFLIFLLLLQSVFNTFGQDKNISSLEAINSLPPGVIKVKGLNAYAEKIQFADPEKAIAIIDQSVSLASKINDPLGLSVAYSLRAGLLFYEMKLDSSKLLLNKAYNLLKNQPGKEEKNQAANIINKFAAIDQRRQHYDSAVEKYLQAAAIFQETGNESKIIYSYYNLSGIYKFLGDTAKMFSYARETNMLAEKSHDSVFIIRGLIALGDAYNFVRNYDSMLLFAQQGLLLAQQQQLTFGIGIFHNFLGLYHTNRSLQYDTAIAHYQAALASFENINTQYDIALVYQNMGHTYLEKRDFKNAVTYSSKAAEMAGGLKLDQVLYASLKDLVQAEESLGNINESFKHLKQFVEVSDSIQMRNNQKKVYQLEARYQEQQKQVMLFAQQKTIERKNLLNYLLASGVLSLVIIFTLLYRNYRHKQKLQEQRISDLETEKQLMATEAVLKGEEQERTRLAQDLHDGLGGMLSGIKYSFNTMKGQLVMTAENTLAFERSMDMLDSSIKEMRRVAHNMMPEALVKFGLNTALKDFCNDISNSGALRISYQSFDVQDMEIDQVTAITIYRIVQELINNTMKHATASSAIVQLSKTGNIISVTVEDDGKGFDASTLQEQPFGSTDEPGHGIGWQNIKNRIEFLKGKIDVQSAPQEGTSVHIELNIGQ